MKKILVAISLVAVCAYSSFAVDTLITGFDAVTGIGTFKVTSDGTDATLTVNKATITSLVINGTNITGNVPAAAITNALTTTGGSIGGNVPLASITNALVGTAFTTNVIYGNDGSTNTFIFGTVGPSKVLKSLTTTGP